MQKLPTKPSTIPQAFSPSGLGRAVCEGLEVLVGLGLSGRQARIYLALVRVGDAKARALSSFTRIDRQEVYRILLELERLGLVRRHLSVPTRFSALPIAQGTGLLIERRLAELNLLTKQAMKLTKKLKQNIPPNLTQCALSFGVVSETKGGNTYRAAIEGAQHRVQVVVGWVQFRELCFRFEAELSEAVKRGVMVEILTEKPPVHCLPDWVKAALVTHPNFKLKTTTEPPTATMVVSDGTQAVVAFNPNSRLTKEPKLWTEHPALVAACQSLFWDKWDRCEFGDG
ncbi:MAG: TrmB family transcriptional regulator [Candidatus Bathyarchaeia archaeon]|jgi:sugar-specific transcriptional regulator TrmB